MPATLDSPALLTRDQAAEYLGVASQTLAIWAMNGPLQFAIRQGWPPL